MAETAGVLLNRVTIEKQAQSLVSQHKLCSTDLVLFEIERNDLFQIIDTTDPQLELANSYYKNAIRNWGLYDNLPVLMTEFKTRHPQGDVIVNFNNLNLDFMKIIAEKSLNAQRNPALLLNANVDDYFFFDIVHLTREVHQLAMEHYYQTVKEWT